MKKVLLILITILYTNFNAQDLRGAYIETKWVSGFTYSISVTLFCDASKNINRPTIPITFGDGNNGTFSLTSNTSSGGVAIKKYSGTHTYPGTASYNAFYFDTNRVAGIKNMSNSQTQKIYVKALITVNFFIGANTTASLSNPPLNFGVSGGQVVYNGGYYDIDGDSLSYAITNCYGTNYYLPSNAVITNTTGTFTFSKDSIGLYAFSFNIFEWRKNSSNINNIISSSQIDFIMDITSTIGINEIENKNITPKIYPNPFTNQLTLNTTTLNTEIKKLIITNILGQTIYQTEFYQNNITLHLPQLQVGAYIATLYLNNQFNYSTKLIKE